MSYILDALRKSDQQRRLGGVPTLTSAPVVAVASERSAMLFYGLFGVILIAAAGTTIAWLRPSPPEPAVIEAIAAKPIALPSRQPVAVLLPATPMRVAPEPIRHEPPSAEAAASPPATPAPRRKPPASVKIETRNIPPAVVAASPGQAATTPHGNADKGAPEDMSSQKPMASSDLPSSIRKTLPAIVVAVHAYSITPRDRLVSINGRMLREGDTLAPDLKLEQITPDGMIFTYRGYHFRRGAQ
jgi:general secretion pathway protein B